MDIIRFYKEFKYQRAVLLILCIVCAFILYKSFPFQHFVQNFLNSYTYLAMFLAGALLTFGFTAPFSIAFFMSIPDKVNLVDGALVGGFGAMVANIILFNFLKYSMLDEKTRIKNFHRFRTYDKVFNESVWFRFKSYITLVFSGIILTLPFVSNDYVKTLGGFNDINDRIFIVISIIVNALLLFGVLRLVML